jgi:hypothetical protein
MELDTMSDPKALIEALAYQIVARNDFLNGTIKMDNGIPEICEEALAGLRSRVKKYPGAFVLFDPCADDEGFLLVGDNPNELAQIAVDHLEL